MRPFAFLLGTLRIGVLGALALAAPVAAQTDNQAPDQRPAHSGRCQAEPESGQQQKPPVNNGVSNNSLTDTLDPCNGVLQPPTGDEGMTAPPPDEGETPVIKPGEVPAQPPEQ
ncbi:hypothetical protein [Mesorhizobium sp.]|uniref:hypothetical protein n=1 Tax=Mesorhizobium sp. TaxID=1871066 RepID=UPI00120DF0E3|nr:hypothetical protein [Mesorhizobium sp.]TIO04315.1 MAG: hypothetical protein E5X88_32455 [Mesorhizobium sp.]TIO28969.1 MAG: hypothetical protein E5X89_32795 [Mesorhizobium sp.]TIP08048.1 MAG: hypothetical protein E5X73_33765 [Mesorhizobium sp.]